MLDDIIKTSLQVQEEAPGDYTEGGVLYCGVCRKPKQKIVHFSNEDKLVGISCDCTEAAAAEAATAESYAVFTAQMERRRLEDGICDPTYRAVTFSDDDRKNEKVSRICRRYVEQWDKVVADNIGLLFYGPVGTGKSFFACCIANELLKRHVPTAVTSFPRLLNLLQSAKDRQGLLDRLSAYKLLVVDDLGVERDTGYAAEQIFAVIDARSRSGLPVIVTTNLTMQEMDSPPSMQYKRIFDRVTEMCPVKLLVDGESRRVQNAQRRREIAKTLLL